MAIGDDALAAGMDILDPATDLVKNGAAEENKTRDYIAQRTSAITPVDKGGTGSSTAAGARTNLGVYGKSLDWPKGVAQVETSPAHQLGIYYSDAAARGVLRVDITDIGIAKSDEVDAASAAASAANANAETRVSKGGDTMTGHLFLPNSTAGGSGTIAYIQTSDGRLTRGVSARRYKQAIEDADPSALGDIFPQLVEYEMRPEIDPSGRRILGYIADDMVGGAAERFVVRDAEGEVDAIDLIQMLMTQVAALHARLTVLEARDA